MPIGRHLLRWTTALIRLREYLTVYTVVNKGTLFDPFRDLSVWVAEGVASAIAVGFPGRACVQVGTAADTLAVVEGDPLGGDHRGGNDKTGHGCEGGELHCSMRLGQGYESKRRVIRVKRTGNEDGRLKDGRRWFCRGNCEKIVGCGRMFCRRFLAQYLYATSHSIDSGMPSRKMFAFSTGDSINSEEL